MYIMTPNEYVPNNHLYDFVLADFFKMQIG